MKESENLPDYGNFSQITLNVSLIAVQNLPDGKTQMLAALLVNCAFYFPLKKGSFICPNFKHVLSKRLSFWCINGSKYNQLIGKMKIHALEPKYINF